MKKILFFIILNIFFIAIPQAVISKERNVSAIKKIINGYKANSENRIIVWKKKEVTNDESERDFVTAVNEINLKSYYVYSSKVHDLEVDIRNLNPNNKSEADVRIKKEKELSGLKLSKNSFISKEISKSLNNYIGSPEYVYSRFDASKKVIKLSAGSSKYRNFTIKFEITRLALSADEIEDEIDEMDMLVIFEDIDSSYIPKVVVIYNDKKIYRGKVVENESDKIYYGEKLAVEWMGKVNQARAADTKRLESEIQSRAEEDKRAEAEMKANELAERKLEAQRAANYAAEKAVERATWPPGAVAKVSSGAFLCSSYKTAYKAMVLQRANNPYISMPEDCITLPRNGYAVSVQHINGGMAQVRLVGATAGGYTDSNFVQE